MLDLSFGVCGIRVRSVRPLFLVPAAVARVSRRHSGRSKICRRYGLTKLLLSLAARGGLSGSVCDAASAVFVV